MQHETSQSQMTKNLVAIHFTVTSMSPRKSTAMYVVYVRCKYVIQGGLNEPPNKRHPSFDLPGS